MTNIELVEDLALPIGTAALPQILTGHSLSTGSPLQCSCCGDSLGVGDIVFAYGRRELEQTRWTVPAVYCWGCAPSVVDNPTRGVSEAIVGGKIGARTDPTYRVDWHCLTEIELRIYSPPTDG